MSVEATNWAWEQRDSRGADKLVLLALAARADEECRCSISFMWLEVQTGLSTWKVSRCIARLESAGLLEVVRSKGYENLYLLQANKQPWCVAQGHLRLVRSAPYEAGASPTKSGGSL